MIKDPLTGTFSLALGFWPWGSWHSEANQNQGYIEVSKLGAFKAPPCLTWDVPASLEYQGWKRVRKCKCNKTRPTQVVWWLSSFLEDPSTTRISNRTSDKRFVFQMWHWFRGKALHLFAHVIQTQHKLVVEPLALRDQRRHKWTRTCGGASLTHELE